MTPDERITRLEVEVEHLKGRVQDGKQALEKLRLDVFLYTKVVPAVFGAVALASAYWGFKFVPNAYVEKVGEEQIKKVKADMALIDKFAADLQRTDGASGCTQLSGMQMCWGSIDVRSSERHVSNPDVISGYAKYPKMFRAQPTITTGLRTQTTDDSSGHGCTWSIYNSVPGTDAFNVAAILVSRPPVDPVQCQKSRVTISYVAIGEPSR